MKIIKNKFLYHLFFILFVFICSFYFNALPDNTTVASGDFYNVVSTKDHLHKYLYMWINQIGQGGYSTLSSTGLYYFILTILNFLFVKTNLVISATMSLFLISSFYSFYYFAGKIFKLDFYSRYVFSFAYAFNLTTYYILTYSWGYTHHIVYYFILPLLVGTYYQALNSNKEYFKAKASIFGAVSFLSLSVMNNISFGFLIAIFLVFITTYQLYINFNKKTFVNVLKLCFLSLIVLYWYFFMNLFYLLSYLNKLNENKVIGKLNDWLSATSSNFINSFSGLFSSDILVNKNTYILSIAIFFLIIIFFIKRRGDSKIWPFIFLLIIYELLVRIYNIFGGINLFIYNIPGFSTFRSPDKLLFSYPFIFLSVLIYYYLNSVLKFKKYLIFILLLPSILWIKGDIVNILHRKFESANGNYSKIVKIPNEYFVVKDYLIDDPDQKILSLPFSKINSYNWVNYPKWNFVGHDITHLIYNNKMIFSNSFDNPTTEEGLTFNLGLNPMESDVDFLHRIQKFGVKYVFVHKDIDKMWYEDSEIYSYVLDKSFFAEKIFSGEYIDVFKIKDDFFTENISANTKYSYKRISPVKYNVKFNNIFQKFNVNFLESYHPEWKLYLEKYDENLGDTKLSFFTGFDFIAPFRKKYIIASDKHFVANDYANGWTIDENEIRKFGPEYYKENEDGSIDVKMTLYFRPQSYFIYGLIISSITFLLCIIYLFQYYIREFINKRKNKTNL